MAFPNMWKRNAGFWRGFPKLLLLIKLTNLLQSSFPLPTNSVANWLGIMVFGKRTAGYEKTSDWCIAIWKLKIAAQPTRHQDPGDQRSVWGVTWGISQVSRKHQSVMHARCKRTRVQIQGGKIITLFCPTHAENLANTQLFSHPSQALFQYTHTHPSPTHTHMLTFKTIGDFVWFCDTRLHQTCLLTCLPLR